MLEKEKIIKFGVDAINNELDNIHILKQFVDDSFADSVNLILNSSGRVVISGIGKSAIIAQKIVATLNSTGTPSLFMHAADAIHGDLGMIQNEDIVIIISKSGNTSEIKALIPLVKKFGNKLIGMVGNLNSYLALNSDIILNTTIQNEACPNNLAPTTSTTAQLIMGDALAVALIHSKKFTSHDFSKYHPGGSLGKQLYLTVGEMAKNNNKPKVSKDSQLKEVISEISKNRMGAVVVCNSDNQVEGIITDGDIRRLLENVIDINSIFASHLMNKNPITIDYNTMATEVSSIFKTKKINQIIITENNYYFGIIHIQDLYKEGIL